MGLLRSEDMSRGTLVLPRDRARNFIEVLGKKCLIEFADSEDAGTYTKQLARISDLNRILRCLMDQISSLGSQIETGKIDNFLENDEAYNLDRVEEALSQLYLQFTRFSANNKSLTEARNLTVAEKYVVMAAYSTYKEAGALSGDGSSSIHPPMSTYSEMMHPSGEGVGLSMGGHAVTFSTVAGVIPRADQQRLTSTLFRATRGNCFTLCSAIQTENNDFLGENTLVAADASSSKTAVGGESVFVVYFQGGENSAVGQKVLKIAKAFTTRVFNWPSTLNEAQERLSILDESLEEKQRALDAYERYFVNQISVLLEPTRPGGNSLIEEWRLFCQKEMAIYSILNKFEGEDIAIRAKVWFPSEEEENICSVLQHNSFLLQCSAFLMVDRDPIEPYTGHGKPPMSKTAPTYIKHIDYIAGFQSLVNVFGIPRYKELNPAIVGMTWIPAFFGLMYGDIGHGFFFVAIAAYLFFKQDELQKKGLGMILDFKYMILLFGFFAVYSGFLYNDFMAVGTDVLGKTHFKIGEHGEVTKPKDYTPYTFGLDPAWKGATNEDNFVNSFKMKTAIVLGVFHSSMGIICKAFNSIYNNNYLDLFFEVIPQMCFYWSVFGYMAFLIVFKWLVPWYELPLPEGKTSYPSPPAVVDAIMRMMLNPGSEIEESKLFYKSQKSTEAILLAIALIALAVHLLAKPFVLKSRMDKKNKETSPNGGAKYRAASLSGANAITAPGSVDGGNADRAAELEEAVELVSRDLPTGNDVSSPRHTNVTHHGDHHHEEHHEEAFGEIMMSQAIETVEFALSSISNTASYLRLWAMSMAHVQLSLLMYKMILLNGLIADSLIQSIVLTTVLFPVYIIITTAVILMLETMSCSLHTLRLQWIEFQSRFYKGDGYSFTPFRHKSVLESVSAASN